MKIFKIIIEYLNGDFAYKKYLEKHQHKKPLSKDEFLREKRLQKSREIKCC